MCFIHYVRWSFFFSSHPPPPDPHLVGRKNCNRSPPTFLLPLFCFLSLLFPFPFLLSFLFGVGGEARALRSRTCWRENRNWYPLILSSSSSFCPCVYVLLSFFLSFPCFSHYVFAGGGGNIMRGMALSAPPPRSPFFSLFYFLSFPFSPLSISFLFPSLSLSLSPFFLGGGEGRVGRGGKTPSATLEPRLGSCKPLHYDLIISQTYSFSRNQQVPERSMPKRSPMRRSHRRLQLLLRAWLDWPRLRSRHERVPKQPLRLRSMWTWN